MAENTWVSLWLYIITLISRGPSCAKSKCGDSRKSDHPEMQGTNVIFVIFSGLPFGGDSKKIMLKHGQKWSFECKLLSFCKDYDERHSHFSREYGMYTNYLCFSCLFCGSLNGKFCGFLEI